MTFHGLVNSDFEGNENRTSGLVIFPVGTLLLSSGEIFVRCLPGKHTPLTIDSWPYEDFTFPSGKGASLDKSFLVPMRIATVRIRVDGMSLV